MEEMLFYHTITSVVFLFSTMAILVQYSNLVNRQYVLHMYIYC